MTQAGWFVYTRVHGQLSCHKYHIQGDTIYKTARDFYESTEVKKFPLTIEEYDTLSLDQLKAKYPLKESA